MGTVSGSIEMLLAGIVKTVGNGEQWGTSKEFQIEIERNTIINQLTIFGTSAQFGGAHEVVHPVVLQDASHLVLVDCGYVESLPQIEQALMGSGFFARDLTHVYIMHQDHDRMDALADLKNKYPGIQVVAGREEAPYISGAKKSPRLTQAETTQKQLPSEQQEFGKAFCALLKGMQPVPVDIKVRDGDVLDWCSGCIVLTMPGHTPGHISLYPQEFQTLIAGDAIVLENGALVLPNSQYTLDMPRAQESMQKLPEYGAKELVRYHGGRRIPA